MICNHCTMCDRSSAYFKTRNGWICNECRDEIIAAYAYAPGPDDSSRHPATLPADKRDDA